MVWFWYFLFYSFAGFLLEVAYARLTGGRPDRKCLLVLPLCPVYGLGACAVLLLPGWVRDNPLSLFLLGGGLASWAEYLAALFYEEALGVSFWDYSGLPGNVRGRICLPFSLIWGILAIGVFITYKLLDFSDLTVDGSFCTGGAVAALLILNGTPVWLAMIAAFVAGALAGFITAILHTKMGIPPILAGILTQLALYSVNLRIMGKSMLAVSVDKFPLLVSVRNQMESCLVAALFVVAIIAVLYWFFGTELGSAIRATGANSNMSRAQGINTDTMKVVGLVLSNGLVGLSGALYTQYLGSVTVNMGRGAIVIGLAAVIIGEVLFMKLFRNFALRLAGVVIGAIVYYVVIAFVIQLGLNTDDLKLFSAAFVAIALFIPYWKSQHPGKTLRKGGKSNA